MRLHSPRIHGLAGALLLLVCVSTLADIDKKHNDVLGPSGSLPSRCGGSPPDSAVLVSPGDMATDVDLSPALEVTVADPDGDSLTVTYYGRPVFDPADSTFSIIHLPDTQFYSGEVHGGCIETFIAQTQWIVDNIDSLNIAYVAHVGDIVQRGDCQPGEWVNAWLAMQRLEDSTATGMPYGLPYSVAVGNHDQTPDGDPTGTTTYYNQYYGSAHFEGRPYYGGHFSTNNDNSFSLFSAGGLDFIVITMEYDTLPDADVLAWADVHLRAYPNRWGIVNCHSLLGRLWPPNFSTQGQAVYDALKANPNLFLMLCGHLYERNRSDTYNGRTVHTVMADYQGRPNGGNGWLRIVTVAPSEGEMLFTTYSVTLDSSETDAGSEFTLSCDLVPSQEWETIGTVTGIPSGSTASIVWPDRAPLTEYEWCAVVSDGDSCTTGPIWSFTTSNGPPAAEIVLPDGGELLEIGAPVSLEWCAADDIAVTSVDLLLSRAGSGGPYEEVATGLENTGSYEWVVTGPGTDQATVKVVAHDADGNTGENESDSTFMIAELAGVETAATTDFVFNVVSGGPLNRWREFGITAPYEAHVAVTLFDVRGREVAVIADRVFGAGEHTFSWNTATPSCEVSPGVYFVRMEAPGTVINRKIVLLR